MTGDVMAKCPYSQSGKHSLMAFFADPEHDYPLTLVCSWCGMEKQTELTRKQHTTESLDALSAEAIWQATRGER